jgi:hypothetical protein
MVGVAAGYTTGLGSNPLGRLGSGFSKPREDFFLSMKTLGRSYPADLVFFKKTDIKRQRLCYSRLTRSEPAQPARTRAAGEPPRAPLRSGRAARAFTQSRGPLVRSNCSNSGNRARSFLSTRIPSPFISILSSRIPIPSLGFLSLAATGDSEAIRAPPRAAAGDPPRRT